MIIDWYTIIFQIINFIILVFLLRRFLYGPITKAMSERKEKIIQREEDASALKKKGAEEALSYRTKIEELQNRDEELMEKAVAAMEEEKLRLIELVRIEIDEKRNHWQEDLNREKEAMGAELRRRIGEQATSIARKCLLDLSGENGAQLETLIWDGFIEKLKKLPEKELLQMREALSGKDSLILLYTTFTPSDENLHELKSALKMFMPDPGAEIKISLKNNAALICGIELHTGGYSINRSVDYYLKDVETRILKVLDRGNSADSVGEVS